MCNEYEKVWEMVCETFPKHSRILVTGANGLIASNVVEALMYFNNVYNLKNTIIALCRNKEKAEKRFQTYLKNSEFELHCQDVCTFEMKEKCEYIIHAASNAHPLAYATKPIETIQTNIIGTMKVLEYACKVNVKRIVYVSTSEIYGEGHDGKLQEDEYGSVNPLNSRSCYSESKRCAENLCVCYCKEKGLNISIVRPGYIYGAQITEDNSRADAQFLRNVLAGEDIVMKSEGVQRRSYCYVADAVSAILCVMMHGKSEEAYNIANTESEASIREYAEILASQGGVKVKFDFPSNIEKKGYSVVKNSLMSDKKLREIGWVPQFDLNQGVQQMLNNACWVRKC